MKKNNKNADDSIDDIVDTLIKLPTKNLEERIECIKKDLRDRETILDSSLSILESREIEIVAHLRKMKYSLGDELNRKIFLENELTKIRNTKITNAITHFNDTQKLKEKLQAAKEQLSMEKEKRKLIT